MVRAVLIDDEIGAREVLSSLIERYAPDIEVVGEASNLLNGIDVIRKFKPSIVFLDVQMPNYYGYEIGKFFDDIDFHIIFTTAYDENAIKAFELAALDYLLKPIDIDRFQQSISRLRSACTTEKLNHRIDTFQQALDDDHPTRISLLDKGFHVTVELDEVVAIEGQAAYSKIYLLNGKTVTQSKNLKQMGKLISGHPDFYRTHRSWLINKQHLVDFSKSRQTARLHAGVEARISRDKMDAFVNWIRL